MIFEGVCTALVTPFDEKNQIDYAAVQRLIKRQDECGVGAILLLGSTGEGFALGESERKELISFARTLMVNQKLIVGVASNSAREAARLINEAEALGADACLVTTPYFTKCTQEGIFDHFKEICRGSSLPLILYNIPSRSGVNIEPQTMLRLCELRNIQGIKEANGDIGHILKMFATLSGKTAIYCGNDNLNFIFKSLGASGTISVASNAFPREVSALFEGGALAAHNRLFELSELLFCEPNPIPIKYVLSKMKLIKNNLRAPLTRLSGQHQKALNECVRRLK